MEDLDDVLPAFDEDVGGMPPCEAGTPPPGVADSLSENLDDEAMDGQLDEDAEENLGQVWSWRMHGFPWRSPNEDHQSLHDGQRSRSSPGTEFQDDDDVRTDLADFEDAAFTALPAFGKGADLRHGASGSMAYPPRSNTVAEEEDALRSKHIEESWAALSALGRHMPTRTRSQDTTDVGASGSPNSDGRDVVAEATPRSTPRSPLSADGKPWQLEDELCTRSALVTGNMEASISSLPRGSSQSSSLQDAIRQSKVERELAEAGTHPADVSERTDFNLSHDRSTDSERLATKVLKKIEAMSVAAGPGADIEGLEDVPMGPALSGEAAATSAGGGGSTTPKGPRPFLKKGSRMPRSGVAGGAPVTKPIAKPEAARKPLRLQPRAASETFAGGGVTDVPVTVAVPQSRTPAAEVAHDQEDLQRRSGLPTFPLADKSLKATQRSLEAFDDMAVDEWADLFPFDGEKTLFDEELDLEMPPSHPASASAAASRRAGEPTYSRLPGDLPPAAADIPPEPPVSNIVRSYFHPKSQAVSSTAPAASCSVQGGQRGTANGRPLGANGLGSAWPGLMTRSASEKGLPSSARQHDVFDEAEEEEEVQRLKATLEQQLKKFERENEGLQRLRAQFEQSERDLAKQRDRLWSEVEAEKKALHAEFDSEKAALRKEKRRLSQSAERQRHLMTEDRESQEERRHLRERNEQLEEELREKEKRWQRTVDRLQRQIGDLTRKNQELQEEVKRANQQAQAAEGSSFPSSSCVASDSRRGSSLGSARARRSGSLGPPTLAMSASNGAGNAAAACCGRSSHSQGPRSSSVRRAPAASSASSLPRSNPAVDASAGHPPSGVEPKFSMGAASSTACSSAKGLSVTEPAWMRRLDTTWGTNGSPSAGFADVHVNGHSIDKGLELDAHQGHSCTSTGAASVRTAGGGASSSLAAVPRAGVLQPQEGPAGGDSQEVVEVRRTDDRTEKIFKDGRREVEFTNGLRKVMWADGRATVFFQNGDRKEIHPDKVVVYHYCETGAVQTTLPDKTEVYRFADGQFERHYPDGSKEIRFPNGTSKQIFADGAEEIVFADGTVRRTPAPAQASK
mmetsp:Transcript_38837/g.91377  ORF Transcript_38837/g.91377 Transcript_38837/m.91377 type:complete len:1080 (+) Transcript_38837:71-3310(+)